jgi:SynChlorMet cassette protein ScmD
MFGYYLAGKPWPVGEELQSDCVFALGCCPCGQKASIFGYRSQRKENAVDARNPVANPLIVLREEFDDWAILFDPDTGNAFGLNPTGVFIWKQLDGKHATDDIVRKLREDADDVPEEAAGHVREFIASLEKQGLVGYEETPSAG